MIPHTVLVLADAFGEHLDAERVAIAIAHGLETGGRLECDLCPLQGDSDAAPAEPAALLDGLDFNRRMRCARAVVIAHPRLNDRTLAGSVVFEAATRARQAGVPSYAVCAHDELDPFEARIVDLQVILRAGTPRMLRSAGRKLAQLV